MKKIGIFFIFTLFSIAFAQVSNSFFVIHCDPGYATNLHFNKLRQMVDSAGAYNVPLTMEFSPQWVNMILADPNKLSRIRIWQQQGHEIAAHHHGIYHCFWDSLTNYPLDSIILHQPAGPPCDSGALISNMQPFWDNLDSLAGDSLMLTWGARDEHPAVDIYPNVIYRTDGGREVYRAFSNPYQKTYQTTIGANTYGPYTTCQIDYCFIDNIDTVNALISLYNDTNFTSNYSVVGVVTHVFDFLASPNYFYMWLKFISGKGNKTVRQILRESGCTITTINKNTSVSNFKIYTVPRQNKLFIEKTAHNKVYVNIQNVLGQTLFVGTIYQPKTVIETGHWGKGIYFIRCIDSSGRVFTRKIVL